MNGNKAVLDSNFLIFLSKGLIDREPLRAVYDKLYVSIISYIEVYSYNFVDETQKHTLDDVFTYLEIVTIESEVAQLTIAYRKTLTKRIKLADAIILATAATLDADFITDNYRDLQNIDPSVKVLNLDEFKIQN